MDWRRGMASRTFQAGTVMELFKTKYRGKGPFKPIADALNAIGTYLNGAKGYDGVRVVQRPEGPRFYFNRADTWNLFGYSLTQDDTFLGTLTVRARTIYLYQYGYSVTGGRIPLAQASAVLSGTDQYVYAEFVKSLSTVATLQVSSGQPATDASYYRIELYHFTRDSGGEPWELADPHTFDVHLEARQ